MITLAEQLAAINIEIGVQQLIVHTAFLSTLDDMIKNGGTEKTRLNIKNTLVDIKDFSERIDAKLAAITQKGPG